MYRNNVFDKKRHYSTNTNLNERLRTVTKNIKNKQHVIVLLHAVLSIYVERFLLTSYGNRSIIKTRKEKNET